MKTETKPTATRRVSSVSEVRRQLSKWRKQIRFCRKTNETYFPAIWEYSGAGPNTTASARGRSPFDVLCQHAESYYRIPAVTWRCDTLDGLAREIFAHCGPAAGENE